MRKVFVVYFLVLSFAAVGCFAFCDVLDHNLSSSLNSTQKNKIERVSDEKIFKNSKIVDKKNENIASDRYLRTKHFIKRACTGGTIFGIILLLISKNSQIRDLLFSTLARASKPQKDFEIFENFSPFSPPKNATLACAIAKNLPILLSDLKKNSVWTNIVSDNQLEDINQLLLNSDSKLVEGKEILENPNPQTQSIVLYPQTISLDPNTLMITDEISKKNEDFSESSWKLNPVNIISGFEKGK